MYKYNRRVSDVIRTPAQWQECLLPLLKEQAEGLLLDQGLELRCKDCYHYEPVQYPALAYIDFQGPHTDIWFLYQSQVMELLGLDGWMFNKNAAEYGSVYVHVENGVPKGIPICSQRLMVRQEPAVTETIPVTGESLEREI